MILVDGNKRLLAHIHPDSVKITPLGVKEGLTCPDRITIAAQVALFGNKTSFDTGDQNFGQAFAVFLLETGILGNHKEWSLQEDDKGRRVLREG